MDDQSQRELQALQDAALIHAARRELDAAIAGLVVKPLDEAAATKMRQALGSRRRRAESAWHRLNASPAHGAPVVADVSGDGLAADDQAIPLGRLGGTRRHFETRPSDGAA